MGQHLQAEKRKLELAVLQLDHVLGGGDHSPGPAGNGFFLELLQKAGGVVLMIFKTGKAAQGNALFGQGLPEGLGPGNSTETKKWGRQGREGKCFILSLISCLARCVRTEKNRFMRESTLQESGKLFRSVFVGRSCAG